MLIKPYVRFLIRFKISNHALIVAKPKHRAHQLAGDSLPLGILLNGKGEYASEYTPEDKARFEAYLAKKMALIKLENKDEAYLRERILTMYANPALNKLGAEK